MVSLFNKREKKAIQMCVLLLPSYLRLSSFQGTKSFERIALSKLNKQASQQCKFLNLLSTNQKIRIPNALKALSLERR